MGDRHSKLTASSQVKTDVIKFFENEVKLWDDTIKNLKDSWKDPANRSWVLPYLYEKMEETEIKWANIKSLIKPQDGNTRTHKGSCSIEGHRQLESEINQLRQNNETLLQSKQENDVKITELQEKIKDFEKQQRSIKDNIVQKVTTEASESKTQCENMEQNQTKEQSGLEKDESIKTMRKQTDELEEKVEEQKADRKRVNGSLVAEKEILEQRIKEFEKQIEKLKIRNQELEKEADSAEQTIEKTKEVCVDQKQDSNQTQNKDKQELEMLRKQCKDMDADFTRQKLDLVEQQQMLTAQKDSLENLARDLQKEKDALLLRNQELEKEADSAKTIEKTKEVCVDQKQDSNQTQNKDKQELEMLRKKIKDMDADFTRQKLDLTEQRQMLTAQKDSLENHARDLQKEKDALLLRLSKFAGDRLVDNNPAIADLSDGNRPTKLGEMYSEIYDNEWTDAFEALGKAGYDDMTAIETLRLTLENVMQFCQSKAKRLIKKSSNAVNLLFEEYSQSVVEMRMPSHLTMPRKQAHEYGQLLREKSSMEDIKLQHRWKPKTKISESGQAKHATKEAEIAANPKLNVESKLIQLRKEMATSMVPTVQKAYIEASWTNDCIESLKPFIMKCLYLGWMMVVQSPPMALHKCPSDREIKFDKNLHKEYTATGPVVSYVVWPALLLQEQGPVVWKGVAEGKKPDKKD